MKTRSGIEVLPIDEASGMQWPTAAPMAEERETAQWYAAGGIGVEATKKLIAGVLGAHTKEEKACYHFGAVKMWSGLPEQVRDALRRELYRIRTQATAPHQFEEIPGNRPILKDKCNQCGADRNAPIHSPAQPDAMERLDAADLSVHSVEAAPRVVSVDFLMEVARGCYSDQGIAKHVREVAKHWTPEAIANRRAANDAAHNRREG